MGLLPEEFAHNSEGQKYPPKVFSALKTRVPQQAKRVLVYTKKLVFKVKRRKIQKTPKSLLGVCGGPLCAVLVYRFWPPNNGLPNMFVATPKSGESKVLVFFRVWSFNLHAPYICPPTIWAISLEFCRKPSILEADDFLGACYRKAMTPQSYGLYFVPTKAIPETVGKR